MTSSMAQHRSTPAQIRHGVRCGGLAAPGHNGRLHASAACIAYVRACGRSSSSAQYGCGRAPPAAVVPAAVVPAVSVGAMLGRAPAGPRLNASVTAPRSPACRGGCSSVVNMRWQAPPWLQESSTNRQDFITLAHHTPHGVPENSLGRARAAIWKASASRCSWVIMTPGMPALADR